MYINLFYGIVYAMKEYDHRLRQVIENQIDSARPLIENNFGSLPNFRLENSRSISVTPWRIAPNFRSGESSFRYYPRWFKKHSFLIDPVSGELNTEQNQQEYADYSGMHELIHLYQLDSVKERLGKLARAPYPILMTHLGAWYGDWLEGSVELATLQLGAAERATSELGTNPNFVKHCVKRLASIAAGLYALDLIPRPKVDLLQLPYEISENMKEDVDIAIIEKIEGKKRIDHARYSRGMFYCAMIASKTSATPADLLSTPMSNDELKEKAEL